MKTLFSFLVLITLVSCSKTPEISGNWKLTDLDYSEFIKTTPKEMRSNLKQQLESQTGQLVNKTFFNFKKDSTMELTYPNDYNITIKGSWSLSKNNDSVYLEKEDPESFKIVSLTNESLVLKTNNPPQRTLHFTLEK